MSIRDSIYTDPDAVRLLYLNPKDPLRALSEVADIDGAGIVAAANSVPVSSPVSLLPGGGGGGGVLGGGGSDLGGCPAVGQWTLRFADGRIVERLVESLKPFVDHLWNPIECSYRLVVAAEIVEAQPCVRVTSMDGAESVVSITDRAIQNFADTRGRAIHELFGEPYVAHGIVTTDGVRAYESEIRKIEDVGRQSIVRISLEGGAIYASGTDPFRMTLRHNNKQPPGGGDGGFNLAD